MHLLRKLVFVLGLAALMAAQPGYALGLGNSELHSALNQPFSADIQLTNLRGLNSDEIIVRLASSADFQRAGIDLLEFYHQLEFELRLDDPDGPMVRITSHAPVREPYLNFLVEARWASGRLLREYTFLLDLPTFDDERGSAPVQAATQEDDRQRRGSDRVGPSTRGTSPSEPDRSVSGTDGTRAGSSDTYRVNANDTLWEIALQARPGRDLSVQQTMLAIQQANPDAFINGNINLLREGQVLRMPTREQILRETRQRAVRKVAEQNQEWSQGALGAQLDAGQRTRTGPRETSEMEGQVRLAAPAQGGGSESGQSGGESTDSGAEADLAAAREELDKSRRENRELSSRVEELEAQIDTMESLIEASNEQLRALQATAQQNRDIQDAPAQGGQDQDSSPAADAAESEDPADTQTTAETPAQKEDRGKRVVSAPAPEKTLMDHVMDNLLWVGLGLLLLLLLIWFAVRHRQAAASNSAVNDEADLADDETFDPTFDSDDYAAFQTEQEDIAEETDNVDVAPEDELPSIDSEDGDDLLSDEVVEIEAETGDVVGEADIYIAYGKLDQARELLLKGLEKEPTSVAIRAKLLEVHAENRDVSAFDVQYAALLETEDREAIQRASELRDTIPGAGEFDIAALDAAADSMATDSIETNRATLADAAEDTEEELLSELDDESDLTLNDDFAFDLDDAEQAPDEPLSRDEDVESPSSRYDLSFDEDLPELDLNLDDEEFALSATDADVGDEADEAGVGNAEVGETEKSTDVASDINVESDIERAESDEWDFDFTTDNADSDRLETLDDELSLLDDASEAAPTDVSTNGDLDFSLEDAAPQEAGTDETALDEVTASQNETSSDPEATIEWDNDEIDPDAWSSAENPQEPAEVESSALGGDSALSGEPSAENEEPSAGNEESSAGNEEPLAQGEEPSAQDEQSSADSETSDDLDLDNLDMDDLDLSSLDDDMSGLDADLDTLESNTTESAPQSDLPATGSEDLGEDPLEEFTQTESDLIDEDDMDAELDFLADADEAATKLDLARAYIDMGDTDGARDILNEVRQEGNEEQQAEAAELLGRIDT